MDREAKTEYLARSICGKPPDVTPSECHSSLGWNNPLCHEYEACRIAEKSEQQLNYILSSIKECVFLKACPGSGKTEAVGMKAAFEMMRWKETPGGIAVLAFTNNAAKVIEKRAGQFAGVKKIGYPHFIGTIDSWLHGYIAHPFAHFVTGYDGKDGDHSIRVVDNTSQADFLNAFKTSYGLGQTGNPTANQYFFDTETGKYIFASGKQSKDGKRTSQTLKEWQEADLESTKMRFEKAGFATYQDIERICLKLLSDYEEFAQLLSRRFPFIVIDECQDLSWRQIHILDNLRLHGTALHLIGDLNQAIYEFKKVVPEKVAEYTHEKNFNVLPLSINYRSCQQIADLCTNIVCSTDGVTTIPINKQEYPCVCLSFERGEMMELPVWFSGYLDRSGIDKQRSAIVTRSWANVSRMRPANSRQVGKYQERLAMAIHLWKTGCRQATEDALKFFGCFVTEKYFPKQPTNNREHYRPEFVDSALTWRLFLAAVLGKCCQDERLCNLGQTWENWAQATRNTLHEHLNTSVNTLGAPLSEYDFHPLVGKNRKHESFPVFATPQGKGNNQVSSIIPSYPSAQTPLRITTIHNVKGETLEALMLVSALDKRGTNDGYWTQWLDDLTSEAARLAYVASSRPRQLIVWAVPKPSRTETDRLAKMGFKVLSMSEDVN
ncbi:MAG: UvrD-helicase domain-containing protein [Actinomycetota bacterium]|nr:UvrD-helicase domain-containing protein [Actinomycetota bacterium]